MKRTLFYLLLAIFLVLFPFTALGAYYAYDKIGTMVTNTTVYWNGNQLVTLPAGTATQVLTSNGSATKPYWAATAGGTSNYATYSGQSSSTNASANVTGNFIVTGNITSNRLKTSNLSVTEDSSTTMAIRDSAGENRRALGVEALSFESALNNYYSPGAIRTANTDDAVLTLEARDNGVTRVEVARLQGAADPYLSAGGSQQYKFYNSGTANFSGSLDVTGAFTKNSSNVTSLADLGKLRQSYKVVLANGQVNIGDVAYYDGILYMAYTGGGDFASGNLSIMMKTSSDYGKSWSANTSITYVDASYQYVMGNGLGGIMMASDGLHVSYTRFVLGGLTLPTHWTKKGAITSPGVVSWGAAVQLTTSMTGTQGNQGPSRIIEAPSGTLLVSVYSMNSGGTYGSIVVLKSTNAGATWGNQVTSANGTTDSFGYDENQMVSLGGNDIMMMIRGYDATLADYPYFSKIFSTDAGATWGARSYMHPGFGPPEVKKLSDGRLVSGYRRYQADTLPGYTDNWVVSVLRISYDDGVTWTPTEIRLDQEDRRNNSSSIVEIASGIILDMYSVVPNPNASPTGCDIRLRYIDGLLASYEAQKSAQDFIGAVSFNNANIATTTGTLQTLTFNSDNVDSGSFHLTAAGSNNITTIEIPGTYLVQVQLEWAAAALGFRYIALIKKTDATHGVTIAENVVLGTADTNMRQTLSAVVPNLKYGDVLSVQVIQTSTGALNVVYTQYLSPIFSVVRLGGTN